MDKEAVFADCFNLLCGEKIGSGIHRDVFECRLRSDLVVKVETDELWRYFANANEMRFWSDNQHYQPVAKWLAPCEYMSPDGRILLQRKVRIASDFDELPSTMPGFLCDFKPSNYGFLDGRLVCVDYGMTIGNPNVRLKKVSNNWGKDSKSE